MENRWGLKLKLHVFKCRGSHGSVEEDELASCIHCSIFGVYLVLVDVPDAHIIILRTNLLDTATKLGFFPGRRHLSPGLFPPDGLRQPYASGSFCFLRFHRLHVEYTIPISNCHETIHLFTMFYVSLVFGLYL